MTVLRRLAVWLIETCCEAILLMLMILVTSAPSAQRTIVDDVPLAFFGTVIVFMIGSGYWLTTALGRLFLSSRNLCVYPTISAVLFIVHEQFLFSGWKVPDGAHLQTQILGACLVFICTFIGSVFLRRLVLSS